MRNKFIEITAVLYVFLYLYTGFSKALDVPGFIAAMKHSSIINPYSETLGWLVPAVEILIAISLILPFSRFVGLMAATGLMAAFTVYVVRIMLSDAAWPCTCGGIIEQLGWRDHLIVNGSFLILGLTAISLYKNKDFIAINRRSRTPVT